MIALIVTVKVKPGKEDELKGVFESLKAEVQKNEPGNITYTLTKGRGDEDTYTFIEIYADKDAVKLHSKSDHFLAHQPKLGACFAEEPQIKLFDVLV